MSRSRATDEAGFTLIEALVAIAASTIVLFGLTTVLVGVLRGTQRTFTRVNSTQRARAAIDDIENELHSACIGDGETPIQAGVNTTATTLQFVSYYGAAATPTPVWHVLQYNASAHTLVDTSYSVTGTAGDWVQGPETSSSTVLTNVTQRLASSGSPIDVFQYFAYAPDASGTYWFIQDGATADPATTGGVPAAAQPRTISGSGLSTAQAAETVEIAINLSVGANSESLNNPTLSAVNDQIDDTISLRLTSPPDAVDTTGVAAGSPPEGYGPCE